MEVDFGYVQQYSIQKGYGFVSRKFSQNSRQYRNNVWFHISKFKYDYPNLAKELDAGLWTNICFWYEIGNNGKVHKVWTDLEDIPKQQQARLIVYIRQIWCDTHKSLPEWLDQVTLTLLDEHGKDELYQKRNFLILARKEREEKKLLETKAQNEQFRERQRSRRQSRIEQRNIYPEHVYIGLPEHLVSLVLWVAREYRTNPLSHIPGGSDVVVEYHDGRAFGYDWIKKPSVYISTFFSGIVEYASNAFKRLDEQSQIEITKRKISRIFARKYKNESEHSTASFTEIWNSITSNEMPWKSLERFERIQSSQYDFDEDYDFMPPPQSKFEYYGYELENEDLMDKAERLFGIPDPRLLED
jgi:hypothetical protein